MSRKSAGLLLYRKQNGQIEFFLVHPGGPYWQDKEEGAWTIPKGEFTEAEDPLVAACREFEEETGSRISGPFLELSPIRQKSGKWVYAWAVAGETDAASIRSNHFRQEWPYKSGRWHSFPEVDKGAWFGPDDAKKMINPAQVALLEEVLRLLA